MKKYKKIFVVSIFTLGGHSLEMGDSPPPLDLSQIVMMVVRKLGQMQFNCQIDLWQMQSNGGSGDRLDL